MSACSRPTLETRTLRDGRTYAQCINCRHISPLRETADGPWAELHRAAAVEANVAIGERVAAGP